MSSEYRDGVKVGLEADEWRDGTLSDPVGPSGDDDSGWYSIGDNNLGLSLGGLKVLDYGRTAMKVVLGANDPGLWEVETRGVRRLAVFDEGEVSVHAGRLVNYTMFAVSGDPNGAQEAMPNSSHFSGTWREAITILGRHDSAHDNWARMINVRGETTVGNRLVFTRSTSTAGGAVADTHPVGSLWYESMSAAGTKTRHAAIDVVVDGAVSSGIVPTAMSFHVMDDAGTLQKRLELGPDGIGAFGASPVGQQGPLTAQDAGAINSGDATTDGVIGNNRTRIAELETALQNLGWVA